MDVKPIKKIKTPRFPTKQQVNLDRGLLSEMPLRWQRNKMVLTAVSALFVMSITVNTIYNKSNIKVAPVFKHGGGAGSAGGIGSVGYYLSEDEANKIIIAEANSQGLDLEMQSSFIENVSTPAISLAIDDECVLPYYNKPSKFEFHLSNKNKKIAVEYISGENYNDWVVKPPTATAFGYNFLDATSVLASHGFDNAKSDSVKVVGLFYSPEQGSPKELLKMQVKDFIFWLKGQGII